MNILCLGCSWTQGVTEAPYNWVTALSEMMPEHTFYNCALKGSSLFYSVWIMDQFLNNAKDKNGSPIKIDKIIFQMTNEGRVTYFYDLDMFNINDWMLIKSNNLYELDIQWEKIAVINYGTLMASNACEMHPRWNHILKFAKEYYERLTIEHHFSLEHKIIVEYIKSRVDLAFFHRRDYVGIPGVTSIQEILGDKQFKEYVIDQGDHFGEEGARWEASYIKNLLFKDQSNS